MIHITPNRITEAVRRRCGAGADGGDNEEGPSGLLPRHRIPVAGHRDQGRHRGKVLQGTGRVRRRRQ